MVAAEPDEDELDGVEVADVLVAAGVLAVGVEAVGVEEFLLDEPQPASASSPMASAARIEIE